MLGKQFMDEMFTPIKTQGRHLHQRCKMAKNFVNIKDGSRNDRYNKWVCSGAKQSMATISFGFFQIGFNSVSCHFLILICSLVH